MTNDACRPTGPATANDAQVADVTPPGLSASDLRCIIEHLAERFDHDKGPLSHAEVVEVVKAAAQRVRSARISSFVPVLVQRYAAEELARRGQQRRDCADYYEARRARPSSPPERVNVEDEKEPPLAALRPATG